MKFLEFGDNPKGYKLISDDGYEVAYLYNKEQAIAICTQFELLKTKILYTNAIDIRLNEFNHTLEIKIPTRAIKC